MDNVVIGRIRTHQVSQLAEMLVQLLEELGDADDAISQEKAVQLATSFLRIRGNVAFGAWHADAPVGAITVEQGYAVYAGGGLGTIRELYVTPPCRSAGIGSRLLERAVTHAGNRGWERLEVTAPGQPEWSRTRNFYIRAGFVDAGPKLRRIITPLYYQ
ncbi:MAG: GNAT family N-acetyltransferase [Planctomycetota bacterium]|jgi:GNAT superfamily N-acetyltransferase